MRPLAVSSPAFENKGKIPVEHTGYGADHSPELVLTGVDTKGKTMVVVMDDLGLPLPAYNHWVIWNIPVMEVIPAAIPHGGEVAALGGAVQGCGYGKHRYRGPKPPFHLSHEYRFTVYILDKALDLPPTARKRHVVKAMEGSILQRGELRGYYR